MDRGARDIGCENIATPASRGRGGNFGGNMKKLVWAAILSTCITAASNLAAQDVTQEPSQASPVTVPAPLTITLPINTLVEVTPAQEITSKKMKEGTTREFLVVNDVSYQGIVVIPRGAPVEAEVTWRTGKGIVGKSAKFELAFRTVRLSGSTYKLRGQHRQEGRGNTVAALLGSGIITGKSAIMTPGQIVNIFTAEPITASAL